MNLETAIQNDPALSWRDRRVSDALAHEIRCTMQGLAALYTELDPHRDMEPDLQYAALNVWELQSLARALPKVPPVALVLVRESILAPSDLPGQADYRGVVTLEWLRVHLGAAHAN